MYRGEIWWANLPALVASNPWRDRNKAINPVVYHIPPDRSLT